jgi:hypothetical protein
MIIPTPPAWIISVLCVVFGAILFLRALSEKNKLLYGKIGTLVIIAVIYILFTMETFDIFEARTLARYSWILYLLAEISYHVARYQPKLFKKWIGTAS